MEGLRSKSRIAGGLALLLLVAAGLYVAELAIPKRDYFIERRGTIVDEAVTTTMCDGVVDSIVQLESSSGLEVSMRLVRPAFEPGQSLPVIVMLGGEDTGKDAVDLVGEPDGVAYVALDYPYHDDQDLDAFWVSVAAIPGIQQAFLDSPPAVSLAVDWLERQPWFDATNVELVGASLGVPFTAVAGALDERFTRVWLLHGGASNLPWAMHVGRRHIENEFLRGIVARSALLLVYGKSFDTMRWIGEIAPRPLVVVAARDDDQVPSASVQPFIEASESDFVELVWTEGRHVGSGREVELQRLLQLVLSRVDVAGRGNG